MHLNTMTWAAIVLLAGVVTGGCGDDDGSTPVDGGDEFVDCTGMADGVPCGGGAFLCIGGSCSPSSCGDGYIDTAAGEECEDGNSASGDGCEPSNCTFSCATDADCDDGNPCNGEETCSASMSCEAAAPVAGGDCDLEDGSTGVCTAGGLCASLDCGNGTVEAGEDCDDGNADNADGCKDDCTFTCVEDLDCADADACDAVEVCTDSNTCMDSSETPDCDDGEACTADACDATIGCLNVVIDGDGDGFSPGTCGEPAISDGDCDDTNDAVFPGAAELCDSIDNDCDGMTDEDGMVSLECGRDRDGDGFGSMVRTMMAVCTCPSGYVANTSDCNDDLEAVRPTQTMYFNRGYCEEGALTCPVLGGPNFDYDCNGTDDKGDENKYSFSAGCTPGAGGFGCTGGGWANDGRGTPSCGAMADYQACGVFTGSFFSCTEAPLMTRTQACR